MKRLTLYILLVLGLWACHSHDHDTQQGHDHVELPGIQFTSWTDSLEVFVDIPAQIVGRTSEVIIHPTMLSNYSPLDSCLVQVQLGALTPVEAEYKAPGIFTAVLKPKTSGVTPLYVTISHDYFSFSGKIGELEVHKSEQDAQHEELNEAPISFLKEQAWNIPFKTEATVVDSIFSVVKTSGEWQPSLNQLRTVSSPSAGQVNMNEVLTSGKEVSKGQLLFYIDSRGLAQENLEAERKKAKARLDQVEAEFDRKADLVQKQIISQSAFERVKRDLEIALAEYQALMNNASSGGTDIRAPFNGVIHEILVRNGDFVQTGAPLIQIRSNSTVNLLAKYNPRDDAASGELRSLSFQLNNGTWQTLDQTQGKILSIGKNVDRMHPLIPVYAEITDTDNILIGSFTEVDLLFGQPQASLVVPESALLEDYGSFSVIVQLGGESFEKRPIRIGRRNGKKVEVLSGLKPGERVVTKGAYQVKMASMAGSVPEHGHSH